MVPHEVFRYCETRKFDGKSWYDKKFSRFQTIWNLEVVTTSFFGIVDKEYSAEKLDFPFSCIESFDNRNNV